MVIPTDPSPRAHRGTLNKKPPQFSMRSLLIAVTCVAIVFALLNFLAELAEALCLLILIGVIPVCVGTMAVYCRGYRRTFFSAALAGLILPAAVAWDEGPRLDSPGALATIFVFESIAIVACGFTATATRQFLERRGWHLPKDRVEPAKTDQ